MLVTVWMEYGYVLSLSLISIRVMPQLEPEPESTSVLITLLYSGREADNSLQWTLNLSTTQMCVTFTCVILFTFTCVILFTSFICLIWTSIKILKILFHPIPRMPQHQMLRRNSRRRKFRSRSRSSSMTMETSAADDVENTDEEQRSAVSTSALRSVVKHDIIGRPHFQKMMVMVWASQWWTSTWPSPPPGPASTAAPSPPCPCGGCPRTSPWRRRSPGSRCLDHLDIYPALKAVAETFFDE